MKTNIRRMTLDDHAAVQQLWIDCGLSNEPEDDREDIARFLDSPQSAGFVAYNNETIEGVVLCGNDGRYGYLHHLAVAQPQRNKGVGRSLVQACLNFLQRRHVIIMVRDTNKAGSEFWNRLSFERIDGLNVQYLKADFE